MLTGVCRHLPTIRMTSFNNSWAKLIRRSMAFQIIDADTPVIPLKESKRFIFDCMVALDTREEDAQALADLLSEADYRGHYSHGMNRLDFYVQDIRSGVCDNKARPKILKESPSTAWVDGQNALGAAVGNFCNSIAIKKAKEVGIGMVVAKGSNHYGIAGMYTLQCIKEGLIGMSFTNTSPLMVPTRAKNAALGTNPISFGAPGKNDDKFVLDMATASVAVGKIEVQKRKKQPIPEGWALNENGQMETDASIAFTASRLMPLGGPENMSGYKGSGLGMMVEVLCGILGGSTYGPNIRRWGFFDKPADLGQCFIAINPQCFAPDFENRLTDLSDYIRHMNPADPNSPVLVAGDPEKSHMAAVDKLGGVKYVPDQLKTCMKLAKELKIQPLQTISKTAAIC